MHRFLLLIVLSAISSVTVLSHHRHYMLGSEIGADSVVTFDRSAASAAVEVRAAMPDNKERRGESHDWWGIEWTVADTIYLVKVQACNSDFGDFADRRLLQVSLFATVDGVSGNLGHVEVTKNVDLYRGANSLAIEWDHGRVSIWIGSREISKVMEVAVPHMSVPGVCRIRSHGRLDVVSAVSETQSDSASALLYAGGDASWLDDHIGHSADSREGYWHYLDRDTDEARARLGGEYTLAIVSDTLSPGDYVIIYVGGASVNADSWHPMMIKGRLKATPFDSHYDLLWFDSMFESVSSELYADFSEEGILTLRFPRLKSSMRFYRR